MKTNKAEAQEKGSKKAAKKELQKNLANKFFEAVKSLGHDAANIGEDLILVSKFVAKKISKKVTSSKDASKKAAEVLATAVPVHKKKADKKIAKTEKKAGKAASKAVVKEKPAINNVQVTGIASQEKLAQVLSKPAISANGKGTKAKPTINKPTAAKAPSKKPGTTTES
jgi:vacuolar-type H+-ATPase subunit H